MSNTLSFKTGRPIAVISGGEFDGKTIHMDSCFDKKKKPTELDTGQTAAAIGELYRCMGSKLSYKKMDQLRMAIHNKSRPVDREMASIYDHFIQLLEDNKNKEIMLEDGVVVPIWDPTRERSVMMIGGMSGSGKSYFTAECAKQYHRQYPKHKIILFSNKTEDPVFDRLAYIDRIKIDDSIIDDPITMLELSNSLCIFDDVECNPNKDIEKEVERIIALCLQQGRSSKCSIIMITHQLNNGAKTKLILTECHSVTLFPSTVTTYSLNYLLNKYFGFDKTQIKKIKTLPSRWATIHKCPPTVVYSSGAFICDD
tara:strand:- start:47 stop:982 length:936 start_codon:yes stop_codon:yes gene_type:complete